MNKLTEQEVKELNEIILMTGIPRLYVVHGTSAGFTGGMFFKCVTDVDGGVKEIYECRGYHSRKLVEVIDGDYMLVKGFSPYMEGAYRSRQSDYDKYSKHPLLKGAYVRSLFEGEAVTQ